MLPIVEIMPYPIWFGYPVHFQPMDDLRCVHPMYNIVHEFYPLIPNNAPD
jgi:hypothetical protein